ncbi:MAG: hypothetical protein HLUCCX10_13750 [Algoriphagus marincola HL-49]|uniref:Uncharacterized protein n=1 Tax=Algoriphagus marincola HL-49 TaxID=1305737 RepID=A0A0P7Y6D2_9BACT|nr:MAG: hypothetical protein HLUCCX10_13750 [Algoriphagus marincola HL-49]
MEGKSKEELVSIVNTPITEEVIYGSLKKPQELVELEKFAKENSIDLYALGFFLTTWIPYSPQPIDMIPFATTGVDGTYFAFLTDFKRDINLSKSPVVVYSSGGLEFEGHTYSPVLFARNFKDFLSICCQFPNPSAVYESDPRTSSFDMEFMEMMCDEDELEEHKELSSLIRKRFSLNKIHDPNEYFTNFYEERNGASFIKTNDPLNIHFPQIGKANYPQLTELVSNVELARYLEESDQYNRLLTYRNYPSLHINYSSEEFLGMLEVLIEFLRKDGFDREANVLQLNWEKEKANKLLHGKS